MGCDIHSFAEFKKDGKWIKNEEKIFTDGDDYPKTTEPFGWRSYGMFGFLADVRNYSHCEPIIPETRGLPDDSEWLNSPCREQDKYSYGEPETNRQNIYDDGNYHSFSWLTLKELIDFDYEKTFWDRRISKTVHYPGGGSVTNGAALAEEGEGEIISYREHLTEGFFDHIEQLKKLGDPEDVRIIFYFDN